MNQKMLATPAHEPTLRFSNCNHEIRLTESLAAPLIEQTRRSPTLSFPVGLAATLGVSFAELFQTSSKSGRTEKN
jgi:hypothetical protein